jgi:arabinofuranosyltransferase
MVPILPLFYLFTQESLAETRFKSRLMVTSLAIIIVGINLFVSYRSIPIGPVDTIEAQSHSYKYRTCFTNPDEAAYTGKLIGLHIRDHWPAHATVAGNAAGSIPYFSHMKFIDMLGLNDYTIARQKISYGYSSLLKEALKTGKLFTRRGRAEVVAEITKQYLPWQLIPGHGKGDGQYVLSRKPDYIIIGPTEGDTKPWFLGDKEILDNPDFHENYQLKEVSINAPTDRLHYFYYPTKTGILSFKYYERSK